MEVEASGHGLTINLNRAGLHSLSEEDRERITVCPTYRYELTTHYQKLKSSCSYPSHRSEAKKLKNPRRVNKQMSEEIYREFQVSVPIGSGKYNKPIFKLFPRTSPIYSLYVTSRYFQITCCFLSVRKSLLIEQMRCFDTMSHFIQLKSFFAYFTQANRILFQSCVTPVEKAIQAD